MPEDNQVVDEVHDQQTQEAQDNQGTQDTFEGESQNEQDDQQLSELDIENIVASLPEKHQEVVKKHIVMRKDYEQMHKDHTQKTQQAARERQEAARQRELADRLYLDGKKKIDTYDALVGDKKLARQVAKELDLLDDNDNGALKIDDKAQELIRHMPPEEKTALDYLVEQKLAEKIKPYEMEMQRRRKEEEEHKKAAFLNRAQQQKQIWDNFKATHEDCGDETGAAMVKEAQELGINVDNVSLEKVPKMLETLYRSVMADKMQSAGQAKATKEIFARTQAAQKNAARSNARPTPNVTKATPRYTSINDAFDDALN